MNQIVPHRHQWLEGSEQTARVIRLACTMPGCLAIRELPRQPDLQWLSERFLEEPTLSQWSSDERNRATAALSQFRTDFRELFAAARKVGRGAADFLGPILLELLRLAQDIPITCDACSRRVRIRDWPEHQRQPPIRGKPHRFREDRGSSI